MRLLSTLFLLITISGCDLAYVAPQVEDVKNPNADELGVQTLPMTFAIVSQANQSYYTPKSVPAILNSSKIDPIYDRAYDLGAVKTVSPSDKLKQPYRLDVGDVVVMTPHNSQAVSADPFGLDGSKGSRKSSVKLSGQKKSVNSQLRRRIRSDGSVTFPKLGRVFLRDKTIPEAEDAIMERVLSKQLNPEFNFFVDDYVSQKITIGGLITEPSVINITEEPLTLLGAIQAASGPIADVVTGFDDLVVHLYREGDHYQVSYRDLNSWSSDQQVYLRDGDNITIERTVNLEEEKYKREVERNRIAEAASRVNLLDRLGALDRDYVYVAGSVNNQSRFPLPFEQHAVLADALYSVNSRGLNILSGNPSKIYVLRADFSDLQIKAYQLNAKNAANLVLATHFQLRPKDIIFVGNQPITHWNRATSQLLPTLAAGNVVDAIN